MRPVARYTFILLPLLTLSLLSAKSVKIASEMVVSAFGGDPSIHHLTPYLLEIARNGHSLPENEKGRLEKLGFQFHSVLVNRSQGSRDEAAGLDQSYDRGMFRLHYTNSGAHAVNNQDTDGNNVPDYVEFIANTLDSVSQINLQIGYVRPPSDGWYSAARDKGGSDHYDVYLRNITSNLYGYVQPEDYAQGDGNNENSSATEVNAFNSYMVLRNHYNFFPGDEQSNLRVTIAHEYFHAIQFGYDGWEEPWLLEATAVWMEEVMFDEINDCYQYMPAWFDEPEKALDANGNHWYGSFIFFEYIDEHLGGIPVIRRTFDYSVLKNSQKGDFSHWAINRALEENGATFSSALNGMVIANRIMSSSFSAGDYAYEEADAYPVQGPTVFTNEYFTTGHEDTITSTGLERFASQYISLVTSTPVKIELSNRSGPVTDLMMHVILKMDDGSYKIISGPSLNVDPAGVQSIYLAVVSQDTVGDAWDYTVVFQDGRPGTNPLVPEEFLLSDPYPNPFNGRSQFSIYMFDDRFVTIDVVDLAGRQVAQIWKGDLPVGNHILSWNGKTKRGARASSGVYFLVVRGTNTQEWKKLTLVK